MIPEPVYEEYLNLLIEGKRNNCYQIVQDLLHQNVQIKVLYTELFQRSLYRIGKLWEFNRISVAKEHMSTAITEWLMSLTYPTLLASKCRECHKKAIISCVANEFHQIGGKMVADICELNGWDTHFLGANTPLDHTLKHIQDTKPDLIGLSLSVYFNMPSLKEGLEVIRSNFINLDIIVGGQAFKWDGNDIIKRYSGVEYIQSIDELENIIAET